MSKQIITIGRQYGSGGREVGRQLAKKLDVPYYDKNILDEIAKESGFSKEMIEEDEQKAQNGFLYSLSNAFSTAGYGPETLSINEKFFMAQFEYITRMAEEGKGGVIVGRCADFVLKDYQLATKVFIYAEERVRIERVIESYQVPELHAKKTIDMIDRARSNYYKYHTGQKWGDYNNYHLSIDSGRLGIENIVELLLNYEDLRRGTC